VQAGCTAPGLYVEARELAQRLVVAVKQEAWLASCKRGQGGKQVSSAPTNEARRGRGGGQGGGWRGGAGRSAAVRSRAPSSKPGTAKLVRGWCSRAAPCPRACWECRRHAPPCPHKNAERSARAHLPGTSGLSCPCRSSCPARCHCHGRGGAAAARVPKGRSFFCSYGPWLRSTPPPPRHRCLPPTSATAPGTVRRLSRRTK